MKGARGLAIWSVAVTVLAVLALVARHGEAGPKAVALASLAAVVGVLATRGVLRRAICIVVALLSAVLVGSGHPVVVVAGALLALAGLGGAVVAGGWPASGRRYEADPPAAQAGPGDLWSRIDAGDDPTA